MTDSNPYAPPKSNVITPPTVAEGMWRQGNILVMRRDAQFPDRCVKCNAPGIAPQPKVRVSWHAPGIYFLILLNLIIYAIVAAIMRKRATIWPSLCDLHQRKRRLGRWIGWGGFVLLIAWSFVTGILNACYPSGPWWVILFALVLVWAVVAVIMNQSLTAKRIDEQQLQIKGCGQAFLDTLPPYGG